MSVRLRAPVAVGAQRGPSRLNAVLRAGQAHRAAAVRTGVNPNQPPPMNITELPEEVVQFVSKKLIEASAGNAVSVCSDVRSWCRVHSVACRDPAVWRAAFEALLFAALPPAPPAPPPQPVPPPEPPRSSPSSQDALAENDSDSESVPALADMASYLDSAEYQAFLVAERLYAQAVARVQNYEDRVEAVNAERAALEANPPASYEDAFADACRALDLLRAGNDQGLAVLHESLLHSTRFMQAAANINANAIWFATWFADDHERMFRDAIIANPKNARYINPYGENYGDPFDQEGWGDDEHNDGNLAYDMIYAAVHKNPEILQYLPAHVHVNAKYADLEELLIRKPTALQYIEPFIHQIVDDHDEEQCLMLKIMGMDGRALQWAASYYQSDKRIVLAAVRSGGAEAYKWVRGNALRRDPDVRKLAGLAPFPGGVRVRRDREDEVPCADADEEEVDEDDGSGNDDDDDDDGEDHGVMPRLGRSEPEEPQSLRDIQREHDMRWDEQPDSSDEEPASPTSTFKVKLTVRKAAGASSSDEESADDDGTHGLDAGNVTMNETEEWEEEAPPPKSPPQGDYPWWRRRYGDHRVYLDSLLLTRAASPARDRAQSLKGVSGDVIILEEAAYCDPGLVSEVVVPLLSMQQSVLLCISTILDSGNHYSKMMEMTDDYGHNIFETIKITLVCDDCLKTDHPEKCRHKLASMPRWLSSKKVETVRALLAEDPAMLLRESLGISADGSEKAFGTEAIEAMIKRVPNRLRYDVREPDANINHVFVACDPSGGGASAFSIASLVQEANGFLQILGVDAMHTKDVRQTHALLVNHLATIRRMPVFSHCKFVLIFESNLAFESQHLLHAVENAGIKNWVSLSEGQQGTLGWLTTNERKQQMCLLLREALTVGRIAIAHEFFSNELKHTEAKLRIKDELSSYCVVTEPPKTTFGKVRTTYTGKLYGKQDDLCIAIQLSLIGCQKFFQEGKYRNFRAPDFLTPQGLERKKPV